jgi:phenylpropionate dioxygenase-like ring-hydroxylating dioxygenase large terminal subunit
MSAAIKPESVPERDPIRPKFRQSVPLEGDNGLYSQTWWPICLSKDLAVGGVKGVPFLDGKVVTWRGEDGVAHVQSAWCPHMGTDLSVGKVVGNAIQCAFHNWEFGATGQCIGARWAKKVPEKAALFNFPTIEKWGFIWAFNGEKPLFMLPDLDFGDGEGTLVRNMPVPINECDPFMFTANAFDFQHFGALHDFWPSEDVEGSAVDIRFGEYDIEYAYEGQHWRGEEVKYRIRIFGTNIYLQTGTYQGRFYANLVCAGLPRQRYSDTWLSILMPRSGDTPEQAMRDQHDMDNIAYIEMKFIMQDAAVLNGIKFGPGFLLPEDKHFVKFVNWVRKFPKANPALHYIT